MDMLDVPRILGRELVVVKEDDRIESSSRSHYWWICVHKTLNSDKMSVCWLLVITLEVMEGNAEILWASNFQKNKKVENEEEKKGVGGRK